jgi:uncharacterized protein YbjT (DUF2867 family)
MENQDKINILIVGATGNLGSLITKHSLTHPNLITNILVRDPQKNKELTSQVEKAGGKVIQGDVTKPETLKGVTKGMHTVILAVSYEPQVLYDGQKAVIDDAVANGVKRVIPTDYSENFADFSREELKYVGPIIDKLKIEDYLKSLPIKTLQINTAIFIESFYGLLFGKGFEYWGDGSHRFQLTSYEDSARFIVAAVARKDLEGRIAYVANEVSIPEAAEIYNKVRGTNKQAKKLGSLEDMKKQAEELRNEGDPSAWLSDMWILVYDGRSRFSTLANKDFPEVKATTIEELLKEKPEIQVSN